MTSVREPTPRASPGYRRQELAARGEAAAAQVLVSQGYRILEMNYRCRVGEIDVVAQDGNELVFVEVKTRRSVAFGSPLEAVDPRKQRRLVQVAAHYMATSGASLQAARFDVVGVHVDPGGQVLRTEIVRDAFTL